jgi:DNA polymerase-3 subunit epsilon
MIASAPPAAQVMPEALRFAGKIPLVAHNASFDKKFWDAELDLLAIKSESIFACTLLLYGCTLVAIRARKLSEKSPIT